MSKWKENPGYCPVNRGTIVDVRFRDRNQLEGEMAGDLIWSESFADDDIAFYRVVEESQQNVNLQKHDGKWWLEVPQSATVHDIAKAWEALNNG